MNVVSTCLGALSASTASASTNAATCVYGAPSPCPLPFFLTSLHVVRSCFHPRLHCLKGFGREREVCLRPSELSDFLVVFEAHSVFAARRSTFLANLRKRLLIWRSLSLIPCIHSWETCCLSRPLGHSPCTHRFRAGVVRSRVQVNFLEILSLVVTQSTLQVRQDEWMVPS